MRENGAYTSCLECHKLFYVPKYRLPTAKYCSRRCLAKGHLAKYSPIYGFKPTGKPPRKYKQMVIDGKIVREHRWIMEQHLGRKLSRNEHVHHINGDCRDNRLENLCVLTNSEHQKLEHRERREYKSFLFTKTGL